jgi:hypothetical protein
MLNEMQVDQIINDAALAVLKRDGFRRVTSAPTSDSDGEDALLVTVILPETWQRSVDGKRALDTIVKIQQSLFKAGELRMPIVGFATESELDKFGSH